MNSPFLKLIACSLVTLTTYGQCAVQSAPYNEDFENASWIVANNGQAAGIINNCWNRTDTTSFFWRPGMGYTTTTNTGPSGNHTPGGVKYMVTESRLGGTAVTTTFTSPWVSLVGLTNPEFSYWGHQFGFGVTQLQVQIRTFGSSSWSNLVTTTGQVPSTSTGAYTKRSAPLSSFLGDTVQVRFIATKSFATIILADMAIDDIYIGNASTCTQANPATLVTRTQTSLQVNWPASSTPTAWQVMVVKSGAPISTAIVYTTTTKPFTIPNLTPSTNYDIYVRDSCASGSVGAWSNVFSTFTACGNAVPYSVESFEASSFGLQTVFNTPGTVMPCWISNPNSGGYAWSTAPLLFNSTLTGPSGAYYGSKYMVTSTFGTSTNTVAYLRTGFYDISAMTNPQVSFWYHMFGNNIQSLEFQILDNGSWVTVLTINGQQQTSNVDVWKKATFNLSTYISSSPVVFRFKATRNSSSGINCRIAIDHVEVDEGGACPDPQLLTATGSTSSSISLSWNTSASVTTQISYGPIGTLPGGGTIVNATGGSATINGLSASTTYIFWIRDSCNATDQSNWVGPVTYTTDCAPVSAPYTEDFESSAWQSVSTFGSLVIDPCWSTVSPSGYHWNVGPPPFMFTTTGPNGDHTTGSGKYMFTYQSGTFVTPATTTLYSVNIDLTPLDTAELSFYYHMFGAQIGTLSVEASADGSNWVVLKSFTGQQHTSNGDPWKEEIVDLSTFVDDTITLRFVATRTTLGTLSQIAIDDIDIHERPSCPKPSGLTATGATANSIQLQWTTGGANDWQILYGPASSPLSSYTMVNATSNPFTLNGLNGSTVYNFYVRDSCGPGDVSLWLGPITASTICTSVPAPWNEDFNSSVWVPSTGAFNDPGDISLCWSRSDTVNYVWKPTTTTNTFASGPTTGNGGSGKFMWADAIFFNVNMNTDLITPQIDLSPLDTGELSFWYHMYGSNIGSLKVLIASGTGPFVEVDSIVGQQQSSKTDPWQEYIVDLSNYVNQSIRVKFRARRTVGVNADISIDDVDIHERPSCPKPKNLSLTVLSDTSMLVSWTSGGSNTWNIEYGAPGFTPGSGTIVSATSNPFVLTGLTAATAYDIYVRDSCAPGSVSVWVGAESATTFSCASGCEYTLILSDQFGDGWSTTFNAPPYHSLNVNIAGNITNYSLQSGSTVTYTMNVCDSDAISLSFVNVGAFSNECGFQLLDANGNSVYNEPVGGMAINSGTVYTGMATCACPDPVGLSVSGVTGTSGVASWTTTGGNPQFAYGAVPYPISTATRLNGVSSPFNMNNLTPNTTYQIYVRDSCGPGEFSNWVSTTFTTPPCPSTMASFTSSVSGTSVSFDASASTGASVYAWNFGDGNLGSGSNVTHVYTTPGIYTVTLTVNNTCNNLNTLVQNVIVCGTPTATYSFVTNGMNVEFDASGSIAAAGHFSWNLGDGNNAQGDSVNYTYTSDGNYYVVLTLTDTCGNSVTFADSVLVCNPPAAAFAYNVTGLTSTFHYTGTLGAVALYWDFGDGNSGVGDTISHTYGAGGTVTVTLIAVNLCGDSTTVSIPVDLCQEPVASFTGFIVGTGGNGMVVQFDGTASLNASTYTWYWGDGSSSTGANFIQHTYAVPGLFYNVTLVVTNECGDQDSITIKLSAISVEEFASNSLLVSPNPVIDGRLQVTSNHYEGAEFRLLSLDGKMIVLNNVVENGNGYAIVLPNLSAGEYILEMHLQGDVKRQKVVIGK